MKYFQEKSLVIIKPDGVQRSLIGEVIKRIERVGLKLVALKFEMPTKDKARSHYTIDPEWIIKTGNKAYAARKNAGIDMAETDPQKIGEEILAKNQNYITAGPIVIMVWQGAHATNIIRKIVGTTEPKTSDVGTIRGDFVLDSYEISDIEERSVRNIVHASGNSEDAEAEIKVWFKPEEIISYRLIAEEILYDVNMDGATE